MSESKEIQFKGNFPKVLAAFEVLRFVPSIESFEDRIIIQKSIYLLQVKELDFGYTDFDLFLRGPYSPHLTEDMFAWWESLPEIEKIKIRQIKAIRQAEIQVEHDKKKHKSREVIWLDKYS